MVKTHHSTGPLKQLNFLLFIFVLNIFFGGFFVFFLRTFVIYHRSSSKEISYSCFLFRRGGKATPEVRGALGDHLSQLTLGSFQVRSAHTWVFSGTVSSHFGLYRYSQLTLGTFQVPSPPSWDFPGTVTSQVGLFRYGQLTIGSLEEKSAHTRVHPRYH
jgi:hypothetical protein